MSHAPFEFLWSGRGYPNVSRSRSTICSHDDVIKWKHFLCYWPFARGIHRSPVNPHSQRPVTRSFDVFFDLRLNKRLNKQSRPRWFETPLRSLWRHCNVNSKPCSQALAIGLKMRNISRPWPKISSSEGSQDTSACQISGHYCHAFSIKCGNHTFEMFQWVKMPPKLVKSADRDQNIIKWSGYSSIWYFRPFSHAVSRKYPKTPNLTSFTRCVWPVWPWTLGATSSRCF